MASGYSTSCAAEAQSAGRGNSRMADARRFVLATIADGVRA
jgi:hypothetical protein